MGEECEFCDNPAEWTSVFFEGNHSPASGPFKLCDVCLQQQCEFLVTVGEPVRVGKKEAD